MDCRLSRREMLRFLTVVMPTAFFGYRLADYFDDELVCVHVYDLSGDLPSPLLNPRGKFKNRPTGGSFFQIGLPELALCRTEIRLLDLFSYFWPVTRAEILGFQHSTKVLFSLPVIEHAEDLTGFETALALSHREKNQTARKGSLVAVLTLNDFTRKSCRHLIDICVANGVDDLVIFKDPSKPPYLCRYPSQQKGFKKKPPIGGGSQMRIYV